ncbi:uncharacterized protein LOC111137866 isoform X1 [Crassostrea virginica]
MIDPASKNMEGNLCLFLCTLFIQARGIIGSGPRCEKENNRLGCCTNYQLTDGSCIPCIGTFGDNCSGGPCKTGYYGFGCLSKCNCSEQQCDKIKGCTEPSEGVTAGSGTETGFPCQLLVSILGGLVIVLAVSLVAILYKTLRKKRSYRIYQEECITTGNESVGYASADYNTYLECYPTSHTETTEGGLKHNQLEESKTCETGSEHYLPVNQKHPASTDVWKSIKETVEKNRERNSIIQLLSRGSAPTNTSQRYSYVSVVEEQAFSSN